MEVDDQEVEVESQPSGSGQFQFQFSDEEEDGVEEDLEENTVDEEEEVLTSTPDQTPAALTYGDIFGKFML